MLHLFLIALLSTLSLLPSATENVYHQITPLVTKSINIDQPTESQQALLNGATAFLQHGTTHSLVSPEMIQTIASVDFYSDILPQYLATATVSGTIQTALITTQLTDDISVLHERQALVTYLNEHPEVTLQLEQLFTQAASAECRFFSLFQPETPETSEAQKQAHQRLYFTSETCKNWNNNQYTLGFFKRAKLLNISLIAIIPILHAAEVVMMTQKMSFMAALKATINSCPQALSKLTSLWTECNTQQKAAITAGASLYAAYMAWTCYTIGKDIKEDFDLIHNKQKSLIEIAQLIHSIKKTAELLQNNPELKSLLPAQYQKLHELFNDQSIATSPALKDLVENLSSSSFQGSDSYLLSKQGKILATYHKLNEHKGELIPYLEAFGTIDAYISAAKLYQTYQNHPRVTFCLPEFVDAATPVLSAVESWHPLINPNVVVTNDVTMGSENIKNLMITGPNAGGKTTSLMSLIINIIFAQSFGIAPSKSLTLTPFAKIHSYLDITTNLQEGLSLFAAEVDRAKKLKQSILSCTPGQKTFTIIDEIFSGTDPKVASDVGFKFATQLGEMAHSMTIITTHFPRLTDIEKETGTFANYKVADATIMPDGAIVYPFKLVPGISTQNIAQHMLEHEGII